MILKGLQKMEIEGVYAENQITTTHLYLRVSNYNVNTTKLKWAKNSDHLILFLSLITNGMQDGSGCYVWSWHGGEEAVLKIWREAVGERESVCVSLFWVRENETSYQEAIKTILENMGLSASVQQ